jgi:Fe-S cluster assembly protein SufD
VVCDHSLSPHKFLTNSVTEGFVGKNAFLDYFKIQNEHNEASQISSVFFQQEKSSTLNFNTISLHGGLIRNNINVLLNDEYCENNLYGLYLTDKTQHISNYTVIDHAKPNCVSNQVFKGVLDDFANGTFTGKVVVRKEAQKTKAFQSNKNILLTDITKIHSQPHLEIYADDVKCSHGATVGQLDENAIFYCQSRGIPKHEARLLMMFAFANEIVKKITVEPLRERIDDLVNKRLRGELSRCNNCALNCHS